MSHGEMATCGGSSDVRVLVIGGTGFIGPHIARELIRRSHDITVFHRGRTAVPRSGSRSIGCVSPFESVARAISVVLPEFPEVFQSNSQSRHAPGFDSPINFASFHVDPPSTLSSTFLISPFPVHAAPCTGTFEFAEMLEPAAGDVIMAFV